MIVVLTGENSFEISRALEKITSDFSGRAEKIDGSELELKQLPDLLMGGTLFAEKRLVVIKNLSENKTLWNDLPMWLPRISTDVQLILIEPNLDKRTKTYKDLQKVAEVHEFKSWTERDTSMAEKWAIGEAKRLGFSLKPSDARVLVARVGTDQWALYHALEKLAVVETVSTPVIEEIIEANPVENVFNLFETALKGNAVRVREMCATLALSEDAYLLFGLMSTQAFQLMALSVSEKPSIEVAKDLGAHPFALSKLAPYAKKLGKGGAKKVIMAFAEADEGMKTSAADPWLLIERALIKAANI